MTETARPRFVVPIHGEYRMLFRHKEFIKNHIPGYSDENVILIENGDLLELTETSARVAEHHSIGRTFIDEEGLGEVDYETVRERKKLAYGGIISLVVAIDKETGELVSEPQISVQGVSGIDPLNGLVSEARDSVMNAISLMTSVEIGNRSAFEETLRLHLKRFIQKETGAKPVIIPTIVEV